MALILPKGIVVNTPEIGGDIERINSEPLDPAEIAKFWRVYTTTSRRLVDPTAERLENFWWRIWGSRRRELQGATVARVFAHISNGQSFVTLRSPANRDEGSPPLQRTSRHGPGASSATNFQHTTSSRPSTTSSSTASRIPAVMPHPILKKSRGPSSSGPKPTARFISPHDSEVEAVSPVSPNAHVVVQPPSPVTLDPKVDKKSSSSGNGKKQAHVASSAAKKKRPVIVRRKGSQSSNDSASKVPAGEGHEYQASSSGRTPPTNTDSNAQKDKVATQSKFQENLSPSPEKPHKKRPSSKESRRSSSPKLSSSSSQREDSRQSSAATTSSNGDPGPSTLRAVENQQAEITEEELEELEVQRILLAQANARIQGIPQAPAQAVRDANQNLGGRNLKASNRSASEGNLRKGASRYLPHDSKGVPSLAPTLADATGELDPGATGIDQPAILSGKGKGRASEEPTRTPSMFAKRPIQQSPGTILVPPQVPGSLAKSKSQLTLLLEKDRQRSEEHQPKDKDREKDDKKKGKKG